MSEDYGILTNLVKVAGTLISASVAIGLTWRGRAKWEPSEIDIPKGPGRVAGLMTAVAVAIIWSVIADTTHLKLLTQLAIGLAIGTFIALLIYSFLVATQTYRIITDTSEQKIIGGFSYTKRAKKVLSKRTNELTTQEFLTTNNYDPDKVWTRTSRALAKTCFLICYISLTVCGTIALSCAAIVFLLSTPNKEIPLRREKKVIHIAIVLNGEVFYTRQIMAGFTNKLDELLEPTPYVAHYEWTTGIAEALQDSQNEAVFKALLARFSAKPDYLVTVGTQVSEYAHQHYLNNIPIIFIGVTDPVRSGLVRDYQPDSNRGIIAGTVFDIPINLYLEFFAQAFPGKTFGYVYNPMLYHQDDIQRERLLAAAASMKPPLTIIPIPVDTPQLSEEQQAQADIFFVRY